MRKDAKKSIHRKVSCLDDNKPYDTIYESLIGRSFEGYIKSMLITDDERKTNEFLKSVDPKLLERYYSPDASPFRVMSPDKNDDNSK